MGKNKIRAFLSISLIIVTLVFHIGCNTNEPETENNRWLDLLNVLPANENTFNGAYLRDDAYKAEITNKYPQAESPLYPDDSAYVIPLFGESPRAYSNEAWQAELGFVKNDVDKTIFAGLPPIFYYQAVYGRFDRNKIDSAVKTGPYKITSEIVTYQGHEFYSWGGDREVNPEMRTPVRPLGRGNRLALVDNFIFWVSTTDQMHEMIDSYDNSIDSLADIKSYQRLAGTLANASTFRAFFSSATYSLDNIKASYKSAFEQPEDLSDTVKRFLAEYQNPDIPLLKPFEALVTGVGIDEKGYYLVIALYNSSTGVAKDNAAILKQRIEQTVEPNSGKKWQDISTETEISYQGQVTIAKLYGEASKHWNEFAVIGSEMVQPLVMHE